MVNGDLTLTGDERTQQGTSAARALRRAGQLPGIIYGHGKAATPVTVSTHEFISLMHHSGLMKLDLGSGSPRSVVIKDVQYDSVRDIPIHVDFHEVRVDEVISATVPIVMHGTPAGESEGGELEQMTYELEINCAANKMPEQIDVDVSGLHVDDVLTVGELEFPEGASTEFPPDEYVVTVRMPMEESEEEEEEAAEGEEAEAAEPEVIGKGKREEEEEGEESEEESGE